MFWATRTLYYHVGKFAHNHVPHGRTSDHMSTSPPPVVSCIAGFRPRFDCTHQHNLYRFFLLSLLQPLAAMGKHLAPSEQDLINRLSRKNGADFVSRALAAVNKARRRQGQDALTRSPIYRYTKGMTHKRAA